MAKVPKVPAELEARYRPVRLLGTGAMGAVVLADDLRLGRPVALKLGRIPGHPALEARFLREAESLAQLKHPGVVRLLDFGLAGGEAYLAMEYLDGASLDRDPGPDPLATMLDAADALEAIHRAGVLHRDLKPANLFRTREGRVVIVDFGLAKAADHATITQSGGLVGTPMFLAPEIMRAAPHSPASDFWAWGATLLAVLEGRHPFDDDDLMLFLSGRKPEALRFEKIDPSGPVAALVRACFDPDPGRRPVTRAGIEAILAGRADRTRPLPRSGPSAPSGKAGTDPPAASGSLLLPPPAGPRSPRPVVSLIALGLAGLLLGALSRTPGPPDPAAPASPLPAATPAPSPPSPVPRTATLEPLSPTTAPFPHFRNPVDGGVLVLVPAGPFPSRASPDADRPALARPVEVPAFLIDEAEVSVGRYRKFLDATGHRAPIYWITQRRSLKRPVRFVSVEDARAYARWAGGRLPRATEWEKAAAGPEGRSFPWGEELPDRKFASFHIDDGIPLALDDAGMILPAAGPAPGASAYGVTNLAGNVEEYCEVRPGELAGLPVPDGIGVAFVVRGGAWMTGADRLATWYWRSVDPAVRDATMGFRIARDP